MAETGNGTVHRAAPRSRRASWLRTLLAWVVLPAILILLGASSSDVLILLALFLVLSAIGCLLGPISVAWGIYIAFTQVLLGLSDDQKYFLCCTSKNQVEAALLSIVPVITFPPGVLCCLLLARRSIWKSAGFWQVLMIFAVANALSWGTFFYFEWQGSIVACSSMRCNF